MTTRDSVVSIDDVSSCWTIRWRYPYNNAPSRLFQWAFVHITRQIPPLVQSEVPLRESHASSAPSSCICIGVQDDGRTHGVVVWYFIRQRHCDELFEWWWWRWEHSTDTSGVLSAALMTSNQLKADWHNDGALLSSNKRTQRIVTNNEQHQHKQQHLSFIPSFPSASPLPSNVVPSSQSCVSPELFVQEK